MSRVKLFFAGTAVATALIAIPVASGAAQSAKPAPTPATTHAATVDLAGAPVCIGCWGIAVQ